MLQGLASRGKEQRRDAEAGPRMASVVGKLRGARAECRGGMPARAVRGWPSTMLSLLLLESAWAFECYKRACLGDVLGKDARCPTCGAWSGVLFDICAESRVSRESRDRHKKHSMPDVASGKTQDRPPVCWKCDARV